MKDITSIARYTDVNVSKAASADWKLVLLAPRYLIMFQA